MAKSSEIPSDGETASYGNASKRPHQWLLDGSELLPNKKHAMEAPTSNLFSEVIHSNVPAWGNTFCFQSSPPGQFTERLFDTVTASSPDINDKSVHPVNTDHSFGLSMAHTLEDDPQSGVSYGGIRKVKVSQVKDSDSFVSTTNAYRVDENAMCMGLAFGKEEENMIAESYERENIVFISMGQPYNDNNSFASDLGFDKVDTNLISMGQGSISTLVGRDGVYNRSSNAVQESCNKGQSTLISFGGSSDVVDANNSGYEFLMSQSTPQLSETPTNVLGKDATFSSIDVSVKKEETKASKKLQSNSFPSNVRSLLSTGMLDGVPVKYIAWSREVYS